MAAGPRSVHVAELECMDTYLTGLAMLLGNEAEMLDVCFVVGALIVFALFDGLAKAVDAL
ncbi:MAG: hypothetical protein ABF805_05630 [Bifidobacterium sp.]